MSKMVVKTDAAVKVCDTHHSLYTGFIQMFCFHSTPNISHFALVKPILFVTILLDIEFCVVYSFNSVVYYFSN